MKHEEDLWGPRPYESVKLKWDEKYLKRVRLFRERSKPDKPPESVRAMTLRFRAEREALGVSLDEISANTFIQKRLLEAIESGDLENLPGGIYTRSYIKMYARYIRFDDNLVNRAFTSSSVGATLLTNLLLGATVRAVTTTSSRKDHYSNLPKLGEYLLYLFLSKAERVTVIGDLEEEFRAIELKFGKLAAKLYFYKQVLTSLAPFVTKCVIRLLLDLFDQMIRGSKL